ncbi:hypothetical protein JW960_00220 [candidate division KSB1 bacterium]|nr:hypothetical protein [candidate division KSB1 bacterium]
MTVLNKIAYFQNTRNEIPNQKLAKELVETRNRDGIKEIVGNLWHKNKSVQSDCLKVLYEIGYLAPELIADYVNEFLALLKNKNNRLVWGSMIALSTIARLKADRIWSHIDDVISTTENGSVITVVNGVKVLAGVASTQQVYNEKVLPVLLNIVETCIPRDVATHAESMLVMINDSNRGEFLNVLKAREQEMTSKSHITRLNKVYKKFVE